MSNLATSYFTLRRFTDALQLYEETLALQQRALPPDHHDTLANMHNLAGTYDALGRYPDALRLSEQALALRKARFGEDHPNTLWSMADVAGCLINLDRGAEAVPLIDDCVRRAAGRVVDPYLIPDVMDRRLRYFEKAKDAAGCRATAEMWEALDRTDAASLYNAACFRAVTAAVLRAASPDAAKDATAEADRAMAWLTKAVAAGYKDAAHMAKDKDLDALRDRPDFRALLAGLGAGD
jgi:tetratricopeptide (TPR) repeat protein